MKTMSLPVLSRNGIAITIRDTRGFTTSVLRKWQSLTLEVPGVYTLEGPNQAGKSVLIKLLMGALPPAINNESNLPTVIIGEWQGHINHVAEAHRRGLVAIFQDDALIPSMTVVEQLLMRHATPHWQNYGNMAKRWLYRKAKIDSVRQLLGISDDLRKLQPSEESTYPAVGVRRQSEVLLTQYGPEYSSILNKYPRELSGGAKAVARLVQAQLSKNIRVLFLDEAFTGVQADVWPRLVEILKAWAESNKVSLFVVSHNQRELLQWQPRKRFYIEDQRILERGVRGYHSLLPGLPRRTDAFPVFEAPYEAPWYEDFTGPMLLMLDAALKAHPQVEAIRRFLARLNIEDISELTFEVSERAKDWFGYERLVRSALDFAPQPRGGIIIVGGGAMLNLAGMVAATLHRGRIPYVLVPTTIMAMADVVVGSKTGVNFILETGKLPIKHAVGVYENPTAVVLDKAFLNSLAPREIKLGLSECLKHGICQDSELFLVVKSLLLMESPDISLAYDAALRTMNLKRAVLTFDPWEERVGRLLLYGHLHAHSLERALELRISHGEAVYWGLLVELRLAGADYLYTEVLDIVRVSGVISVRDIHSIDFAQLERAYQFDTMGSPLSLFAVDITKTGEYPLVQAENIRATPVTLEMIMASWTRVCADVCR